MATKTKTEAGVWRCMLCGCNNLAEAGACETCGAERGTRKSGKKRAPDARDRDIHDRFCPNGNGQAKGVPATQVQAAAKEAAADEQARSIALVELDRERRVLLPGSNGSLLKGKPAAPPAGGTEDVDIKLVDENPVNTRCNWGDLDAVAESMQRVGQLQECTGRRKGKRVELICGNRRYRAAKLAGLATLRVRIVECDDLTALDIMGEENEKQHTWDAISRAAWLQAELTGHNMTTRELAEHLKVSQADVANHLRLLKLPKAWQDKVISGEITATQARSLATWADRPAVLKEMSKELKEEGGLDTREFEQRLRQVVCDVTRPCEPKAHFSIAAKAGARCGHVLFTEKQLEQRREELDIVTVQGWSGREERRAFNTKRWDELHGNLEAEARKSTDDKAARKGSGSGSAPAAKQRTPAEQKKLAEQQAQQLATKVWRYKVRWLQQRAAAAVLKAEGYVGIKLLLAFAATPDADSKRRTAMRTALKSGHIEPFEAIAKLPTDATVAESARTVLAAWLSLDVFEGWRVPMHPSDVVIAAGELGVDLDKEWRVDQQFLELFTTDQLHGLAKEWKLIHLLMPSDRRGDRVRLLMEADQAKRLPAPKILVKAKG